MIYSPKLVEAFGKEGYDISGLFKKFGKEVLIYSLFAVIGVVLIILQNMIIGLLIN